MDTKTALDIVLELARQAICDREYSPARRGTPEEELREERAVGLIESYLSTIESESDND